MINIECYIFKADTTVYKINNKVIDSLVYNKNSSTYEFVKSESFRLLINNEELEEIDFYYENECFHFNFTIEEGSYIQIEDKISKKYNKVITENPHDIFSLYKVYSKDQKLKLNSKYSLTMDIKNVDDIENFEHKFTTKLDPFYCSIKQIRMDCGEFIDDIDDTQIASMIYLNSKIAKEIVEAKEENSVPSFGKKEKIPRYVKSYVRYKTNIDLCTAIYLNISGKFGSINKTIGSIHITKDIKLPYLKDILKKFEENLKGPEEILKGTKANVTHYVKATTNYPFPGNTRRNLEPRGYF